MASRQYSADPDQQSDSHDDDSGSSYAGSGDGSPLEAFPGAGAPFDGPIPDPEAILDLDLDHPHSAEDPDHNAAPEPAEQQAQLTAAAETSEPPTIAEPTEVISDSPNDHEDDVQAPTATGEASAVAPVNESSGEQAGPAEQPSTSATGSTGASGLTLLEALHDLTVSPRTAAGTQNELPPLPSFATEAMSPEPHSDIRSSSSQTARRGDGPTFQATGLAPAQSAQQARASEPQGVRRRRSEFTLPRWQPDAEVTLCPICRTQFSIFVRKHHCRKCGRVVCANCSPHRITIPYQYIVRPPGDQAMLRASGIWGEEGTIVDFSNIGGGERVRLCNPCVPDPNTTPPQSQGQPSTHGPPFSPRSSHQRSQSTASVTSYGNPESGGSGFPSFFMANPPTNAFPRNRSVTVNSNFSRSGHAERDARTIAAGNAAGRSGYYYHPPPGEAFASSSRQGSIQPRGHASHYYRSQYGSYPASSSSAAAINERPLPPPPQIPEEDECPVCHRELPSRDLPNFEVLREAHINSCITSHSSYSPAPANPNQQGGHGTPPPRAARRTGMFPYVATEKDCVDSAECTICLEEFEEGVPMARLECLCRFHRSCITAWFVNHPGRCPVHQHDSFGY
ncbi:FYVE zinc finger-domain-containing protein [Apiospora saccharicola]|uniref:RING-type E3 ubiquitin transferase n=1 Tax=Apiospora saccharicola TaxID=335842 RepID=A0ABR1WI96_9PEZI